MQPYEAGHPRTEQRPHGPRRGVGVPRVVTGTEQMPEIVHEARQLELLVGRVGPAQQVGGLERVVVQIDRIAAAVGGVPGAPAGVQELHQLVDRAHRPVVTGPARQLHVVSSPRAAADPVSRSWRDEHRAERPAKES